MNTTEMIVATLLIVDLLTVAMWAAKQGISLDTARQQLYRAREFIEHHAIDGRAGYYSLRNAVRRKHGLPERTRERGPRAVVRDYTLALLGEKLVSAADFEQRWPHLSVRGVTKSWHYFEPNEVVLTFVVIDYAKKLHRLGKKLADIIEKRSRHESWKELILDHGFLIEVVTGSEAKATKLRGIIAKKKIPAVVTVIPELFGLMGVK